MTIVTVVAVVAVVASSGSHGSRGQWVAWHPTLLTVNRLSTLSILMETQADAMTVENHTQHAGRCNSIDIGHDGT